MGIDKCKEKAVITIHGEEIENVNNFDYLGARIETNGKSTSEIRRRLAISGSKLRKMANIWKGQSLYTKLMLQKSVMYSPL